MGVGGGLGEPRQSPQRGPLHAPPPESPTTDKTHKHERQIRGNPTLGGTGEIMEHNVYLPAPAALASRSWERLLLTGQSLPQDAYTPQHLIVKFILVLK